MANMSKAESLAVSGEIVGDKNIWQLTNGLDFDTAKQIMTSANGCHTPMPESYVIGEEAAPGFYRITHLWSKLPPKPLTAPDWSQLDVNAATKAASTLHDYIPAAISNTLKNGYQNTQAQLRPMTVCFVRFSGIDYNNDPYAGPRLNNFLRDAQKAIYRYEGSINKLNAGDKGSVLLVLFGAPPMFHEDDEARAVACALDLRQVATHHQLDARIGLAAGPLFLGPLGAARRREYTVIGDVVNLAVRLMQKAEPGQILVDTSVHQRAKQFFVYQDLGQTQVKGRTKPLHIYLAVGERDQEEQKSVVRYLINGQDIDSDTERKKTDQLTNSTSSPSQCPRPATS
jgi:hypothetical protein